MMKKLLSLLAALIAAVAGYVVVNKKPACDFTIHEFQIVNDSLIGILPIQVDSGKQYTMCIDSVRVQQIRDSIDALPPDTVYVP